MESNGPAVRDKVLANVSAPQSRGLCKVKVSVPGFLILRKGILQLGKVWETGNPIGAAKSVSKSRGKKKKK